MHEELESLRPKLSVHCREFIMAHLASGFALTA